MTRRFWVSVVLALPLLVVAMGDLIPGRPFEHARLAAGARPGSSSPRHPRRAVGRLALLRARLAVAREPQPQHVHADRPRAWPWPTSTAWSRPCSPGLFPASFRGEGGTVGGLLRGGGGHRRPGPARAGAGAARAEPDRARRSRRCSAWRRRPRGASATTAARRTSRWTRCSPAIACACARARRCRSTASWSRARASVDESMVTGEPIPVEKSAGDRVIGGDGQRHGLARDARGAGRARDAARPRSCTWWRRRSAAARRSRRLADVVAGLLRPRRGRRSPLITFVVWALCRPEPRMAYALDQRRGGADHRLPLRAGPGHADVDHGGDGQGARRPASCSRTPRRIEVLRKVDTLVVDKTGTLTEGKPKLVGGGCRPRAASEEDLLRLAASLERGSEHPLAAAIVAGATRARRRAARRPTDFASDDGQGRDRARRRSRRSPSATGSCSRSSGVDPRAAGRPGRGAAGRGPDRDVRGRRRPRCRAPGRGRPDQGDDPARPSASLHEEGMRVVMLTGDSRTTAEAVARELGDRRGRRRGAARSEGRGREAAPGRGTHRGHGRRRDQRRARAGPGAGRHRDGHRHRRGHGERRGHAGQGRPARHRPGPPAQPRHDAQHQAEPVLRVRLQRARRADRGRRALSVLRASC